MKHAQREIQDVLARSDALLGKSEETSYQPTSPTSTSDELFGVLADVIMGSMDKTQVILEQQKKIDNAQANNDQSLLDRKIEVDSSHRKRKQSSNSHAAHDREPGASTKRLVICMRCYTTDQPCDPGESSERCASHNVCCKRAICGNYKAGTCQRVKCTRVHENDGYKNTFEAGHVSKRRKYRAKAFKAKKPPKDDDKPAGGGNTGRLPY